MVIVVHESTKHCWCYSAMCVARLGISHGNVPWEESKRMKNAAMCVVQVATSPEIALRESLILLATGKEYFGSSFFIICISTYLFSLKVWDCTPLFLQNWWVIPKLYIKRWTYLLFYQKPWIVRLYSSKFGEWIQTYETR